MISEVGKAQCSTFKVQILLSQNAQINRFNRATET